MNGVDDCIPAGAFLHGAAEQMQLLLADRDRMLEEIYELRRYKSMAIDMIECMGAEAGR